MLPVFPLYCLVNEFTHETEAGKEKKMFTRKTMIGWVGVIFLSGMFLMGQDSWGPVLECVDFEDPAPGTMVYVGTTITDSGAEITGMPFEWSNGIWTSDGYAEIVLADEAWCHAGGTGQELLINNINVEIVWPASIDNGLAVLFAEHGGNINLSINGVHKNAADFIDLVGVIGGVTVSCIGSGCTGSGQGVLSLDGPVTQFYIGGQEFCIDDVCPIP